MKTNWKTIGIAAVTAAALLYPAMKLYQYIRTRMAEGANDEEEGDHQIVKTFSPAYRGKHKPHHRHS